MNLRQTVTEEAKAAIRSELIATDGGMDMNREITFIDFVNDPHNPERVNDQMRAHNMMDDFLSELYGGAGPVYRKNGTEVEIEELSPEILITADSNLQTHVRANSIQDVKLSRDKITINLSSALNILDLMQDGTVRILP